MSGTYIQHICDVDDFSLSDLKTFAEGIYAKSVECVASPDKPSCGKELYDLYTFFVSRS